MATHWLPLTENDNNIESIGEDTVGLAANQYVANNPSTSEIYDDNSEEYLPNLEFTSEIIGDIDCVIDGQPAVAHPILGGPHSPHRPK